MTEFQMVLAGIKRRARSGLSLVGWAILSCAALIALGFFIGG